MLCVTSVEVVCYALCVACCALRDVCNGLWSWCFCCMCLSEQLRLPYLAEVCLQLACGLSHLHSCGVLHRDLKTDNALVQSLDPLIVKWADFGCSVQLSSLGDTVYGSRGMSRVVVAGAGLCSLVCCRK